jgi:hypothetical protein
MNRGLQRLRGPGHGVRQRRPPLFVVTAPNQVAQMDPNTGAILNGVTSPSTGGAGANGLAFDSFTGKL